MMQKLALYSWAFGVMAWGSTASWAKGQPPKMTQVSAQVRRLDLERTLGPLLCEGRPLSPSDLWALGIWDAHLEGQVIDSQDSRLLSLPRLLPAKARTLATLHHGGGYAYGTCGTDAQRGWVLSVPSPAPLHSIPEAPAAPKASPWRLPLKHLRDRCASWRVDYTGTEGGDSQLLGEDPVQVTLSGLKAGLVTLTCQPKRPSWLGPLVWAMRPVAGGPTPEAPFAETLKPGFHPEDLIQWVNLIRQKEHRPVVSPLPELNYYAGLLAVGGDLAHDRQRLLYVGRKIEDRGVTPLGEDRVKAGDSRTMAWLLWNSPRHRALLLDPRATILGWGRETSPDGTLVVLITATGSLQKTSQVTTSKPKKVPSKAL